MRSAWKSVPLVLGLAALAGIPTGIRSAAAQAAIGGAVIVQNNVQGQLGKGSGPIDQGDQVYQAERVRTAAASLAKIVFNDDTNMAVGPLSQVVLDRYVYAGNDTAQQVAINVTKGTFRFISGNSAHGAYNISTPQATIGVRGTIYDVRVAGGQTMIVLQEGALTGCVRGTRRCANLDQPGTSLVITSRAVQGPFPPGRQGWTFGLECQASPAGAAVCGRSQQIGRTVVPIVAPPVLGPVFGPPFGGPVFGGGGGGFGGRGGNFGGQGGNNGGRGGFSPPAGRGIGR